MDGPGETFKRGFVLTITKRGNLGHAITAPRLLEPWSSRWCDNCMHIGRCGVQLSRQARQSCNKIKRICLEFWRIESLNAGEEAKRQRPNLLKPRNCSWRQNNKSQWLKAGLQLLKKRGAGFKLKKAPGNSALAFCSPHLLKRRQACRQNWTRHLRI